MNSKPYGLEEDGLIDMGKRDSQINITIPSIFVAYSTGNEIRELLALMANTTSVSAPTVYASINSTGEEVLHIPSFWDMFISFFQLSVILWIALGALYGSTYVVALYKRYQRRKACYAIPTVCFQQSETQNQYVLRYKTIFISSNRQMECSICLETFRPGERVKILPCKHIFHETCASSWIVDIRGVCPLCRRGIFQKAVDVGLPNTSFMDRISKKNM